MTLSAVPPAGKEKNSMNNFWTFWRIREAEADAIRITAHARRRFAERTDVAAGDIENFTRAALRYGRGRFSYRGECLAYLMQRSAGGLIPIVYQNHVLLFSADNTLVTIYPAPGSLFGSTAEAGRSTARLLRYSKGGALSR